MFLRLLFAIILTGEVVNYYKKKKKKGRSLEELQIILQGNKPDQAHLSLNAGDGSQDEEEVGDNSASNDGGLLKLCALIALLYIGLVLFCNSL